FCLPAAVAASPSAFVSGAAVAKDASAVATAPARTAAPTVDLDILLFSCRLSARRSSGARMLNSPGKAIGSVLVATRFRERIGSKGPEKIKEIKRGKP